MSSSAALAVGGAMQVGGAITGAIGSYTSGNTAKLNYALQAQSDQLNAQLSKLNAQRAETNAQSLLLNADAANFNATVMKNNAVMARKYGDFNARNQEFNANLMELGAQQELQKGAADVAKLTLQAGQLKSTQRASMAANGIDLGEGSAAEVQAGTDIMKQVDMNTLTANAIRNAFGYREQAVNYQMAATNTRMQAESQALNYEMGGLNSQMQAFGYQTDASNARMGGLADQMKSSIYSMDAASNRSASRAISPGAMAMGSLMTGAAQVADTWYRYKKGSGTTYTITT